MLAPPDGGWAARPHGRTSVSRTSFTRSAGRGPCGHPLHGACGVGGALEDGSRRRVLHGKRGQAGACGGVRAEDPARIWRAMRVLFGPRRLGWRWHDGGAPCSLPRLVMSPADAFLPLAVDGAFPGAVPGAVPAQAASRARHARTAGVIGAACLGLAGCASDIQYQQISAPQEPLMYELRTDSLRAVDGAARRLCPKGHRVRGWLVQWQSIAWHGVKSGCPPAYRRSFRKKALDPSAP